MFLEKRIPIRIWKINGDSTNIENKSDLKKFLQQYDAPSPKRKTVPESGNKASFAQFTQYALVHQGLLENRDDPDRLKAADVHVQPQWMRCDPCVLKYDAVLKVSTSRVLENVSTLLLCASSAET